MPDCPNCPACPDCAALDHAPVAVAPHANLLLHSETGINFGGTASGQVAYYVCHACGGQWMRTLARSEPDAHWAHADRPLA